MRWKVYLVYHLEIHLGRNIFEGNTTIGIIMIRNLYFLLTMKNFKCLLNRYVNQGRMNLLTTSTSLPNITYVPKATDPTKSLKNFKFAQVHLSKSPGSLNRKQTRSSTTRWLSPITWSQSKHEIEALKIEFQLTIRSTAIGLTTNHPMSDTGKPKKPWQDPNRWLKGRKKNKNCYHYSKGNHNFQIGKK